MAINCDFKIDCPGSDFPVTNYSAEGPEQTAQCVSVYYPQTWDRGGCIALCTHDGFTFCDSVTQNEADLCALAMAAACPPPDDCPFPPCVDDPPPVFYSTGTVCICVDLGGGAEFHYTVPGATFSGPTQAIADALAHSYACVHCSDANTSFRLGALPTEMCLGTAVSAAIPCSKNNPRPAAWFVLSGTIPTGLTLDFSTGLLHGTPSVSGTFTFTVQATNASGNYGTRSYTICVIEILPATLADGTVGTDYTTSFSAGCAAATLSWQVVSGSLPPGLALDETTGLLDGVPTTAGTFNFTIALSTSAT